MSTAIGAEIRPALPEAAEQLARLLTLALSLTDPRAGQARIKCRMDGYYAHLPGMALFNRLLARAEDADDVSRQRLWGAAQGLARELVIGIATIEEGVATAEEASR